MSTQTALSNDPQYPQSHASDDCNFDSTPNDLTEKPINQDTGDPEALTRLETSRSAITAPKSLPKEIAFVRVVAMAQFMTQVGLCMSTAPVFVIGESFNTSTAGELSWFATSYSLTVGTFILVSGRLGDVFGHWLMFVIGFAWFGLWSLLAGFSVWSNQRFFNCCRALQGMGPAMLLPNAIAILGRTYPPGLRKEMIFSFFDATAPSGFIVGGVFSIFAQLVWWPWAYWVMGMVCFVLAALGLLVIPYTPRPHFKDNVPICVRLDLLGAAAGISTLVLINYAWNQAALVTWLHPYPYVLRIVGFVVFVLFVCIEGSAQCPLVWRWSRFGIIIYYFYQFMEVIKGDTPLLITAKWAAAAPVIMFCAMGFFTAGLAIFAKAFVVSLITSLGMDMSFPSGTLILSNSMPRQHQGLAASLVTTTANYSISLGLGFAGTVESNMNEGGRNVLRGYRGALYLGIGFAGLGLVISMLYMLVSWRRHRQSLKA
ncbi:MFS general substrate transporter [Aspergillus floccosus]